MTLIATLAMTFGSIMALANFPQVYKIFKRKSAKDISVITYGTYFIGAIFWLLYGLEIKSLAIIIPNLIGETATVFIIIGWYLYGR